MQVGKTEENVMRKAMTAQGATRDMGSYVGPIHANPKI